MSNQIPELYKFLRQSVGLSPSECFSEITGEFKNPITQTSKKKSSGPKRKTGIYAMDPNGKRCQEILALTKTMTPEDIAIQEGISVGSVKAMATHARLHGKVQL